MNPHELSAFAGLWPGGKWRALALQLNIDFLIELCFVFPFKERQVHFPSLLHVKLEHARGENHKHCDVFLVTTHQCVSWFVESQWQVNLSVLYDSDKLCKRLVDEHCSYACSVCLWLTTFLGIGRIYQIITTQDVQISLDSFLTYTHYTTSVELWHWI